METGGKERIHTEILDILIRQDSNRAARNFGTDLLSRTPCLINDYTVRQSGRDERKSISELSPAAIVVEGDIR